MVKEREREQTEQIKEREEERERVLSFLDNIKLHLHSLMSVYLGYFQLLSKDTPVSPHYGVA